MRHQRLALFLLCVAQLLLSLFTACSPGPARSGAAADALRVSWTPARPVAGEGAKLVLEGMAGGERLSRFDVVHEKKMHLLIVTPDLASFAHVHPEPQADGTFLLEHQFPHGGPFRLFADFKPTGRPASVLVSDVMIDGPATPAQPLVPTDLAAPRIVDGYEVRLVSPPPVTGAARLAFAVTKTGAPVELEPVLGARGHLVVIGSDARTFLHAHPEDGPGLSFLTSFPAPGLYKAWVQIQVNGEPVIADFVFDVVAAPPRHPVGPATHEHGSASGQER